jgi:serine/threonine-protein kinase
METRAFFVPLSRNISCCFVTVGCLVASTAFAEESREAVAAAEALYNRGVALLEQGKAAEACPVIAESQRLDPGTGTLLALAYCFEKVGKTASAWATYLDAARLAQSTNQPARAQDATGKAKALEPNLAWLKIDVSEAARADSPIVTRGGTSVGPTMYGVEVPVDPGPVEVTASAPGKVAFRKTITVTPSAHEQVEVPSLAAESASAPAAPAPAADIGTDTGSGWNVQKTIAVASAGVGLVTLGLGTYFALAAKSKYDESNEGHCRDGNLCKPQGLELRDQALSSASVATVLVPIGIVGLGAGAALWFTAGGAKKEQPPAAALSVSVGSGHASATLRGAF